MTFGERYAGDGAWAEWFAICSVEAGRDWRGLLVDLATPVAPSTSRAMNVAAGTSKKDEVADACVLVLQLLD